MKRYLLEDDLEFAKIRIEKPKSERIANPGFDEHDKIDNHPINAWGHMQTHKMYIKHLDSLRMNNSKDYRKMRDLANKIQNNAKKLKDWHLKKSNELEHKLHNSQNLSKLQKWFLKKKIIKYKNIASLAHRDEIEHKNITNELSKKIEQSYIN